MALHGTEMDQLVKYASELESRIVLWESRREKERAHLKREKERLAHSQRQLAVMTQELDAAFDRLQQGRKELTEMRWKIKQSQSELNHEKEMVQEARRNIQVALEDKSLKALEQDFQELQKKYAILELEVAQGEKERVEIETERDVALLEKEAAQEALAKMTAERDQKENIVKDYESKLEQLNAERDLALEQKENIVRDYETQLEKIKAEREMAEERVNSLEQAEKDRTVQDVQQVEKELEQLRVENEKHLEQLKEEYERQVEQIKSERDTALQEKEKVIQNQQVLTTKHLSKLKDSKKDLIQKHASWDMERGGLSAKVKALESEVAVLTHALEASEKELHENDTSCDALKVQVHWLENSLSEVQAKFRSERESLQETNESLSKQLDDEKAKRARFHAFIDTLDETLSRVESTMHLARPKRVSSNQDIDMGQEEELQLALLEKRVVDVITSLVKSRRDLTANEAALQDDIDRLKTYAALCDNSVCSFLDAVTQNLARVSKPKSSQHDGTLAHKMLSEHKSSSNGSSSDESSSALSHHTKQSPSWAYTLSEVKDQINSMASADSTASETTKTHLERLIRANATLREAVVGWQVSHPPKKESSSCTTSEITSQLTELEKLIETLADSKLQSCLDQSSRQRISQLLGLETESKDVSGEVLVTKLEKELVDERAANTQLREELTLIQMEHLELEEERKVVEVLNLSLEKERGQLQIALKELEMEREHVWLKLGKLAAVEKVKNAMTTPAQSTSSPHSARVKPPRHSRSRSVEEVLSLADDEADTLTRLRQALEVASESEFSNLLDGLRTQRAQLEASLETINEDKSVLENRLLMASEHVESLAVAKSESLRKIKELESKIEMIRYDLSNAQQNGISRARQNESRTASGLGSIDESFGPRSVSSSVASASSYHTASDRSGDRSASIAAEVFAPSDILKAGSILIDDGVVDVVKETRWRRVFVVVTYSMGIGIFLSRDDCTGSPRSLAEHFVWPANFVVRCGTFAPGEREFAHLASILDGGEFPLAVGEVLVGPKDIVVKKPPKKKQTGEEKRRVGPSLTMLPLHFRFALNDDQDSWVEALTTVAAHAAT